MVVDLLFVLPRNRSRGGRRLRRATAQTNCARVVRPRADFLDRAGLLAISMVDDDGAQRRPAGLWATPDERAEWVQLCRSRQGQTSGNAGYQGGGGIDVPVFETPVTMYLDPGLMKPIEIQRKLDQIAGAQLVVVPVGGDPPVSAFHRRRISKVRSRASPGSERKVFRHLRGSSVVSRATGDNQSARRERPQALLAFAAYLALSLILFGRALPGHLFDYYVGRDTDPSLYMWSLAWWPYVIRNHVHPFFTRLVWAPKGINLALVTCMPLLGIVATPVTNALGPLATYNIISLAVAPLCALTAYLLCRRLCGAFMPALIGGLIFGFSPYSSGQLLSHMVELLVFPIPLTIYLAVRRFQGGLPVTRFVLCLIATLVAQFLLNLEFFAMTAVVGGVAIVIALRIAAERERPRLMRLAGEIAAAYALTAALMSPYIYYFFAYGYPHQPLVAGGAILGGRGELRSSHCRERARSQSRVRGYRGDFSRKYLRAGRMHGPAAARDHRGVEPASPRRVRRAASPVDADRNLRAGRRPFPQRRGPRGAPDAVAAGREAASGAQRDSGAPDGICVSRARGDLRALVLRSAHRHNREGGRRRGHPADAAAQPRGVVLGEPVSPSRVFPRRERPAPALARRYRTSAPIRTEGNVHDVAGDERDEFPDGLRSHRHAAAGGPALAA